MRTTLDLDDDVLQAAKELARREKRTTGQMISALVRKALAAGPNARRGGRERAGPSGFRPFPHRGGVVTNELIDALRGEDAY